MDKTLVGPRQPKAVPFNRTLVPPVPATTIHEISRMTIRYILFRAMDYIDSPDQRGKIQRETEVQALIAR